LKLLPFNILSPVRVLIVKLKPYFYSQIIAGVKNVYRYENPHAAQEREALEFYSHNDDKIDLAIVKVNVPFQFTATVQPITLAPANFQPPGIKYFYIFMDK
jgi:hypothetical protein